eukprot:s889_g10.t1
MDKADARVSLSSIPAPKRQRCEEQGAGVMTMMRRLARGWLLAALAAFAWLGTTRCQGGCSFLGIARRAPQRQILRTPRGARNLWEV